ncbi:sensor histidine kinase [Brumimicrobium aurantiacum]|uniref:histidine kinase n=1 Tax=Brumimicrobium aurantiacum TaxID=1737063 RepID=A0A3E1EUY5_9FLAO|nr:ATP-binding protein [Brumimicrobium aurantiacum]RFC53367.1 PAS domain-containing sensor histidine kinase [Brumimicrobium aurantiacum]
MAEKFQKIFEHSNEGLLVVNSAGVIETLNPKLLSLFGYDNKEELLGQKLEVLIPMRYAKTHVHQRKVYNDAPSNRSMGAGRDLKALRKDGSEFPVEISLSHYQENGETKSIAFVVDISKRVAIDNELKRLNNQLEEEVVKRTKEVKTQNIMLRSIAENFPNGNIYIINNDFSIEWADGSLLRNMGLNDSSLKGISFVDRLGGSVKPLFSEKIPRLFKGETLKFELEFKSKYFLIYGVPLSDKNGITDKALLVEMDVTIEKESELNIERNLKKEKDLNELKSRFVAMASHEFRTPLSTIDSSATLISKYTKEEQDEKRGVHVKRIKRMVTNLTQILNDFLSLEKLESGMIQASKTEFDFNALIGDVLDEVNTVKAGCQEIILASDLPKKFIINTDKNILKNCINNLLTNACKYSSEKDAIKIIIQQKEGELSLSVCDQGIGIPEEDQAMLFSRFHRAGNVTNIEGTGLGLNIVKSYMDVLGGTIRFKSKENEGSTFTLNFPIH